MTAPPWNSMAAVLKHTPTNKVLEVTKPQACTKSQFVPSLPSPYYIAEGRGVGTEFVLGNLQAVMRSPTVSLSLL